MLKEKVKANLEDAIAGGKAAAMLQQDEKNDFLKLDIGNIQSGQEVKVTLVILSVLQIECEVFLFSLPHVLIPDSIAKEGNLSIEVEILTASKVTS